MEAWDFLARGSSDARPYLVSGLIPAESQTIWQGRPKVGKSHTLLQLAFDAAAGISVFGRFPVQKPVRTCYVELEEPESVTKQRYESMLLAHAEGALPEQGALWFITRNDLHRWKLLPRELLHNNLKDFCLALHDKGIELLILIALRNLIYGDINEAATAEQFNDALDELNRETKVAMALAHHDRKSPSTTAESRGLGSTMFAAHADGIFDLSRTKGELRCVEVEARYETPHEFVLCRGRVNGGEIIHATEEPHEAKKRELQKGIAKGASLRQAALAADIPYTSAHRLMKD